MVEGFKALAAQFADRRTGRNLQYRMEDAALGALAVFFTQSPSFLAYQTLMAQSQGKSNAHTLFGMFDIPTDNHIRRLLDGVPPESIFPLFWQIFADLNASGQLQAFQGHGEQLLVALDGTQYHSSQKIHCTHCSVKEHADGQKSYSHSMITPVVLHPTQRQVIALEPEFISPQDGHQKQDCEMAAAKRWIARCAPRFEDQKVTLLGDDLYSRQPLCEQVLGAGMSFIFVCKPQSHKTLYEYLAGLEQGGALHTVRQVRRIGLRTQTDTYRFAADLPLREGEGALTVHWCELRTTDDQGKVLYQNAFVGNQPITPDNVAQILSAGRARWKVENENNNTLKNHGYHLEHNFGHGQQHLAALLATFNLMAFLMHTVLQRVDAKYQELRAKLPSRKMFFQHLAALTAYLCFARFEALLDFMLQGLEKRFDPASLVQPIQSG